MNARARKAAATRRNGPSSRRLPLRLARWSFRFSKAALGVAGGLVTILTLVFLLRPGLQPKSASSVKRATLSGASVDRPVTFGEYLVRAKEPRAGMTPSLLKRDGVFIQFHVEVVGYDGRNLPLRWSVLNARTGATVFDADPLTLRPQAADDSADWPLWAPEPSRPGIYYVFVQLYDPGGRVALAHLRTPSFRVP